MSNKKNIKHWKSSHNDWLRALTFYKGEIDILEQRLTDIAGRNTGKEVSIQIEHFQNQFFIHRNTIKELEHSIRLNLENIAKEIEQRSGFATENLILQLDQQKRDFSEEEKEVNKLRQSFNLFCSKWM